jgi:hypothetical protein
MSYIKNIERAEQVRVCVKKVLEFSIKYGSISV